MTSLQTKQALFNFVCSIKKIVFLHKKKITLLAAIILIYTARKRIELYDLLILAENFSKIMHHLLPSSPNYRQLNRYETPRLKTLQKELISAINFDELKLKLKEKTAHWEELRQSIFSGTILSLTLYNIQSFYLIVENKYQTDFASLGALKVFEQFMDIVRKSFVREIFVSLKFLNSLLEKQINQIQLRKVYNLDEYFYFIERMVQKVFKGKYLILKERSQHVDNSIFKGQEDYKKARNLFMTPFKYISKKTSFLGRLTHSISSKIGSILFKEPTCQITSQRFEWTKIAYQIPLKKSLVQQLKWPNKQSQHLAQLVTTQMDQLITSINFSTLLFEYSKFNLTLLKNRLLLFFSKKKVTEMKAIDFLSLIYRLIKEQVMVPHLHNEFNQQEENKRQTFYQSEIRKAIEFKTKNQKAKQIEIEQELLIKQQSNIFSYDFQQQIDPSQENPELIMLNMHLKQIQESRKLTRLVREFEIKYFNERYAVMFNLREPGDQQNQMKNLLKTLTMSQKLNEKT